MGFLPSSICFLTVSTASAQTYCTVTRFFSNCSNLSTGRQPALSSLTLSGYWLLPFFLSNSLFLSVRKDCRNRLRVCHLAGVDHLKKILYFPLFHINTLIRVEMLL